MPPFLGSTHVMNDINHPNTKSHFRSTSLSSDMLKSSMEASIATVSLSKASVYDRLQEVKRAGFDSFELMEPDLPEVMVDIKHFKHFLLQIGLKASIFQPVRDFEGSWDQFDVRVLELRKRFEIMRYLNINTVLICSSCVAANNYGNEYSEEKILSQLRIACDLASTYKIRIAYEALSWATYINTLEKNWEIVQKVDRPNFGICLDSFHIFIHRSDLRVVSEMKEKIFFVQLCDSELGIKLPNILLQSRSYRVLPGQGDFDNCGLLEQIALSGYKGPLSLECFNESFRKPELLRLSSEESLKSLVYLQMSGFPNFQEGKIVGFECENNTGGNIAYKDPFVVGSEGPYIVVDDVSIFERRRKELQYSTNLVFAQIKRNDHRQETFSVKHISIECSRLTYNSLALYLKSVLQLTEDLSKRQYCSYGLSKTKVFGSGEVTVTISTSGDEKPVLRHTL